MHVFLHLRVLRVSIVGSALVLCTRDVDSHDVQSQQERRGKAGNSSAGKHRSRVTTRGRWQHHQVSSGCIGAMNG